MTNKENIKSFDWVYYVLGLFFGGLTGVVTTGSFGWTILCAIFGFIFAAIVLGSIVKGRVH